MRALDYPAAHGRWTITDDELTCRLPRRVLSVTAPGALLRSILSSCNGRRPWARVVAGLGRQWPAQRVAAFLESLAGEGALVEGGGGTQTFDDRPIDALQLHAILSAASSRRCALCWLLCVLRGLPARQGTATTALQVGAYLLAPDGRALHQKILEEPLDSAWCLIPDPRLLTFASAVAVPFARGEERHQEHSAIAGRVARTARRMDVGCVITSEIPSIPTARRIAEQLEGAVPGRGLILGALPSRENCERERQSRFAMVRRTAERGPLNAGFTYVAGPVRMGRSRVFGSGRADSPRLAALKAEAEAWERKGWATPGIAIEATARELEGAIDPRAVVAYEAGQRASPSFPCSPFSSRRKYAWKKGLDVATGKAVYLPAECVVASHCLPARRQRSIYTFSTTSGVAAWTDFEGALCRATLELIERDAFLRHWVSHTPPQQVPANYHANAASERVRALEQAGMRVHVLRLECELAHAFAVFVQANAKPFTAITAAADFDPELALGKALDEAEGRVNHVLAAPAKPLTRAVAVTSIAAVARVYQSPAFYRQADFMARGPATARIEAQAVCRNWPALKDALAARGQDLLAFDLTPPHASTHQGRTPLHVVRAFVLGLIPIWFHHRLAPAGLPAYQAALARSEGKPKASRSTFIHPFT